MPTIILHATDTAVKAEIADRILKADEKSYSQTLSFVSGDTPELNMTLRDSQHAINGAVLDAEDPETWAYIDATGATVRLRLRKVGDSDVLTTLTCSVVDGAKGKVVAKFSAKALKSGDFEGEIEIVYPSGNIQTVYELIRLKVRRGFDDD